MTDDKDRQPETASDSAKRKLEDPAAISILLAKQKAQEIAARLVTNAESKRPRVDDESFQPNPVYTPPAYPVFTAQTGHSYGSGTSKKIDIPNGKVGVIIGKQGETIRQLQLQSGAKIQITRDSEADLNSLTRDVELTGTSEQISRAEQLINDVIAEADAGGSAPSTNQGFNSMQPGGEQFVMKVPNNKVALIIGKGGETIRNMQTKSGARIQIVPLHLPPGDMSTERSVYINGGQEQIEAAKELVNEVISGKRLLNASGANSYMQQPSYPPSGNWAPPGQPPIQQQQPHYGYTQPGGYGTPPAPPSYYGNYPAQAAGWDQSNQVPSQPPQDSSGYNYYGQQPPMGSAPPNPGYYNQTSQGYAQQPPNYDQGYAQQPPSYDQSYAQQPPSYDQSYAQQPPNYGQNISSQAPASDQQQYATSGYGPPAVSSSLDGSSSAQTTQPSSAYAPPYGQPTDNPQSGYWSHPSSTGQPHAQAGYYQPSYGGQQPAEDASAASYGQGGYAQPDPSANGESQHQPEQQSQPPTNGYADQSSASEAERTGERNVEGDGSAPPTEPVGSQN
ncbi:putative K domain-containing protein [Rosa chinensis]|uniref:Putative K domain-containing protein n=1 Tax=Rosa chinensis TaxID=74649 RepID=A0A2P6PMU1_ROSCH|nr:far upstream element-binding protein 2 [Rosa chinensis]PRQ23253.1 putative K domain-containing protein [Rosa chinensis]